MIINGNSLEVLQSMKSDSIDMCLTSPPYLGLRDYGVEGQFGLEPTPELYIEHMTEVFHEVRRVLRDGGTLWLNIGDTYSANRGYQVADNKWKDVGNHMSMSVPNGMQPKCLCMIPERLAWSLIEDGWILRNKIIWYKPNAMPSSVRDRFSNKWEYLFLFSKQQKYYFDLDSIKEPAQDWGERNRDNGKFRDNPKYSYGDTALRGKPKQGGVGKRGYTGFNERYNPVLTKNPGDVFQIPSETRTMGAILGVQGAVKVPGGKGWTGHPEGGGNACQKDPRWCPPEGPNPGDFWQIPTQPFPEAHFAVFPEKLCDKPIKAGCPKDGIVLDPFCGAGTVGVVAKEQGKRFIGIDIKYEYCQMAKRRIAQFGYQPNLQGV